MHILKFAILAVAIIIASLGVLELFAGNVRGFAMAIYTAAGIVFLVTDR
jgi:hypothetical protein